MQQTVYVLCTIGDVHCLSLAVFPCLWWVCHGKGADGLLLCFLTNKWPVIRQQFHLSPRKSGDIRVRPHTHSGQLDEKFSQFSWYLVEYNRLHNHKGETRRFEKILGQQRITPGQSHFRITTRPPRMQGWLRIILICFCGQQTDDRQQREAFNISIKDGFAGFSHKSFHSTHYFLLIWLILVLSNSQGTWQWVSGGLPNLFWSNECGPKIT